MHVSLYELMKAQKHARFYVFCLFLVLTSPSNVVNGLLLAQGAYRSYASFRNTDIRLLLLECTHLHFGMQHSRT